MPKLRIADERWPIAGAFTISRGSKREAHVVTVTIEENGHVGRGECVPYARYGETVEGVVAALEAARGVIEAGIARADIAMHIAPMAARNALDCALWDLAAKTLGLPAWHLAGLTEPRATLTAFTISLDSPEAMAEAAARAVDRPLLKLKLGREGDEERLRRIRRAVPEARLIVDANEAWNSENLGGNLAACAAAGVELVEQPLPADADDALRGMARPVPVCADESAHGVGTIERLIGKYDAINIKLDKTGGLSDALALAAAAERQGLAIMAGCMLATSLAMAPAFLLAQKAAFVDLDGPLLLARDRDPGIRYDGGLMYPPPRNLWG
jgi:L-alanine-DL-glutamate epimerase-like enolase superfamily enzyme